MLLNDEICENISRYALKSLLYEVSATPKPGLVDRYNSGAHSDMDFFTFMSSSVSLVYYFYRCAKKGFEYSEKDPSELFCSLRGVGISAEKDMFKATCGVNTHKGLIFSLGIISAAAASIMAKHNTDKVPAGAVCEMVKLMTRGLCRNELESMSEKINLTHGERIFKEYGFYGIRGEAENGFQTVLTHSLPYMRELLLQNIKINDILVQVLLLLMAVNNDTNIVARHDLGILEYVKQRAQHAFDNDGIFSESGTAMISEMDREFIEKKISPGGSADLVAITVMFALIEGINI